jgi:hypothetical protein
MRLSSPSRAAGASTVGRSHGLLLLLLGTIVLATLLRQTEGHRARLAAEVLGMALGGSGAVLIFGLTRPSPQVVTRAYVLLSRHMRLLLIGGMALLFGFAVATAAVHRVAPQLREVPGLGGVVTLDWVLSLSMLAIAGSTLLCIGCMAIVARPRQAAGSDVVVAGVALERLWSATNCREGQALRRCFAAGQAGEHLFGRWSEFAGPLGSHQIVLVRSAALDGRVWSEWYARSEDGGSTRRWVLVASEQAGRIGGDGELFEHVPVTAR